ncbi:hypothetical protein [Campylobacter sp. US33a]|uniref:hypothetical protein n=1 Tax=Campylobacter sp. US33a TaxID=2498120 RepID=UPI0010689747|nr:hypothetical protein [Campylobacter sp. US33a]TEY00215.1 hypothetical protein ELQ16_09600 [Campylobacter sp. US33a]
MTSRLFLGLCALIILVFLYMQNKNLKTQNELLNSNLSKAISANNDLNKTLEALQNRHKNELESLGKANKEILALKAKVERLKRYENVSNDEFIAVFNDMLERLWQNANDKSNTNHSPKSAK